MFIARDASIRHRGSDERTCRRNLGTHLCPLVRTAMCRLGIRGYKHVTPSGVKNGARA